MCGLAWAVLCYRVVDSVENDAVSIGMPPPVACVQRDRGFFSAWNDLGTQSALWSTWRVSL